MFFCTFEGSVCVKVVDLEADPMSDVTLSSMTLSIVDSTVAIARFNKLDH